MSDRFNPGGMHICRLRLYEYEQRPYEPMRKRCVTCGWWNWIEEANNEAS